MKRNLIVVIISLFLISCAGVKPKDVEVYKKKVCDPYHEVDVPVTEAEQTLINLEKVGLIEMGFTLIKGQVKTVYLNTAPKVWRDSKAETLLGIVLITFRTYPTVDKINVYFSDVKTLIFSLEDNQLCVADVIPEKTKEKPESPKNLKIEPKVDKSGGI